MSAEHRRLADASSMPVGLLDTYTIEEIIDLLAYLQADHKKGE